MTLSSSQKAVLTGAVRGKIRWDAPLSEHTTYRIGGPADALVTLLDVEDLQELLKLCLSLQLRWKLLGWGANILAADEGFRGIVIVLGDGFKYIGRDRQEGEESTLVKNGAAVSLAKLSSWCGDQGLSGFEFASGIPGTLGGGVVMNAGAWGRSMADVVTGIELVDHDKIEIINEEHLGFSYRSCRALAGRNHSVVTGVTMCFKKGDPAQIRETIKTLREKRQQRQPYGKPTCGSVFKNPEGTSAGRLIDEAGLKGLRIGDAEVSNTHANFIENRGKATARDVQALMDEIRNKVLQNSGIELIPEVQLLS
jgi:UDP-N-acetylmuramate dehydrogenase